MTMFSDRILCYTAVTTSSTNMKKVSHSKQIFLTCFKENESGACLCTNLYDTGVSRYGLQCKTRCTLYGFGHNFTHFWDPKGFLLSRTFDRLVGHVHRWQINGLCDESQPLTKFLQCQKIWVAVLQCDSSYCSRERALVLDKKCHVTH